MVVSIHLHDSVDGSKLAFGIWERECNVKQNAVEIVRILCKLRIDKGKGSKKGRKTWKLGPNCKISILV